MKAAPISALRRIPPFEVLQNEIAHVFETFNGIGTWPAAFADRMFSPSMEVTETKGVLTVEVQKPAAAKTQRVKIRAG